MATGRRRYPPVPNPQFTADEMDVTYTLDEWEAAGQPRTDFAFLEKVRQPRTTTPDNS